MKTRRLRSSIISSMFLSFVYFVHWQQNPSATNTAVDEEGWFNSGDIGWIAPHHSRGRSRRCSGMVVIEGRAKDTIVLSTGASDSICISNYSLI